MAGTRENAHRASIRVGIDARLRAYRGGGIAEHVTRLVEGLRRLEAAGDDARQEVEVVLLEHRKAFRQRRGPSDSAPAAAPPRPRPLWTPPHHRWEGLALPVEVALRGGVDVLHCPDVVVPWAWPGRAVATVHDVAFLRRPELLTDESRRYYGQVHRSVRRARRVITVSQHTRRELLALTEVDPEKIVVVPNAVAPRYLDEDPGRSTGPLGEPEPLDPARQERLGLSRPYVLFVSTIEPRKNVPLLLEAFRALVDRGEATWRGQEVDLALAGGDGWKSEAVYQKADALGLGNRTRWLGWVEDVDLVALYRGATMLAHPALDEGFGMTPLEAMACGTPVVASRAGSLPEVVGEAGLLIDPLNARAWREALARLLRDPTLRSRLAGQGRARASAFTVERQASETVAVYRAAAGRPS